MNQDFSTDEEKINFFDEIASHFYECNFGSISKADMELLMFHFYLDKLMLQSRNEDGTIDYRNCSDYKISKNRKFFRENDKEDVFDEKQIGKSLMNAALDITTLAANISSLISPVNTIGSALMGLLGK